MLHTNQFGFAVVAENLVTMGLVPRSGDVDVRSGTDHHGALPEAVAAIGVGSVGQHGARGHWDLSDTTGVLIGEPHVARSDGQAVEGGQTMARDHAN